MSAKPKELFWVDVKLSGKAPASRFSTRRTAGIRGGKRSSYQACLDTKAMVLRFDPEAVVTISKTMCTWSVVREDDLVLFPPERDAGRAPFYGGSDEDGM